MSKIVLTKRALPQNPKIEVFVPNYKEPILPVNHGGFGWFGLNSYNEQGQIMCHECGVFRNSLGRHVEKHKLTAREYRIKYGLLSRSRLTSDATHANASLKIKEGLLNPDALKKRQDQCRKLPKQKGSRRKNILELQNRNDTCPAQLLRALSAIAEGHDGNLSINDVRKCNSSLVDTLKIRFGTFNKAKQLLKLSTNISGTDVKFVKQFILEDICAFFWKYNRWPRNKDYRHGMMICSETTMLKQGTLGNLIQEATLLKDIQERNANFSKQLPRIAERLEMQNAGHARH